MRKKIKIKKKRKELNTVYIAIALIIVLFSVSIGYSMFNEKLYIQGLVTGKVEEPELPVEIPSQGEDENGVNRYTSNTNLNALGTEIYRVVDEVYEENTVTTTIKQVRKQATTWFFVKPTISLTIPNNTQFDFTAGTIILDGYNDENNIFYDRTEQATSEIAPRTNWRSIDFRNFKRKY